MRAEHRYPGNPRLSQPLHTNHRALDPYARRDENFPRGYAVAIGYMALSSLLILVPMLGPILVMVLGSFLGGFRGGRYVRDGTRLGMFAGFTWGSIAIALLLLVMNSVTRRPVRIGFLEIILILMIYLAYVGIGAVGGRVGSLYPIEKTRKYRA